eukprot:XP_011664127.1 PREDICTED: uncharacterized protein LOC105438245 [Strongylocentrotus purpuratus]
MDATSTNVVPFKNSVAPESMYGNADKPDSDSSDEETEEGQEDQPLARRGFQEVELAMAKQPEEGAETTPETRDTGTEAHEAPEPTADATSTNATPFKNSVAPESMYGNADKPDSDSSDEETEEGQEDHPLARRGFQEVELAMAKQPEEGAETTPETRDITGTEASEATEPTAAKLTVPITELPKPNECSSSLDTKTNNEIIQEFRDTGLVADLVVGKVKPNGVAFDIELDNVRVRSKRPKTAKGFRVPKPPRRLERLEVKPSAVGEEEKKIAKKIKDKQEKAALKKKEMRESRLQKKREKLEKQQKAVEFVAAADDQKRKDAAEYIARQVERAKSARLLTTENRLAKAEAAKQHREDVRSRCCCQECPDVDYDKISTYNGSSTNSSRRGSARSIEGSVNGDESPPVYYRTLACLVPVERPENYDDFFDRPIGGGQEN